MHAEASADLGPVTWRKSSRSNDTGNCVEVAENIPDVVAVGALEEADRTSTALLAR